MRVTLLGIAALILATSARADPGSDLLAWRSICAQQVQEGIIKTAFALEDCDNQGMRRYLNAVQFPWMDLQDTNEAEHLANGDNFDRHKITLQELIAADARADSEFNTALNQRVAAAQQQQASNAEQRRLSAYAASGMLTGGSLSEGMANAARAEAYCRAGLPPPPPQQQPVFPPAPMMPLQTNCQRRDDYVDCTTHQ